MMRIEPQASVAEAAVRGGPASAGTSAQHAFRHAKRAAFDGARCCEVRAGEAVLAPNHPNAWVSL